MIKQPACYDISHYKEVSDFKLINPLPVLLITKATEDIAIMDSKFLRFATGMMEISVVRGFYHFNRKAYNPTTQAKHFVKTISLIDILPTDILILDVEEGGEKAPNLWAWFEYVRGQFPNNRLMLYSRKNILDPVVMTFSEKEYFKKIDTWTAGYPIFYDLFSTVPSAYIPDQTKFGPVVLWQYSSHGRVDGITTELGQPTDVDLNWVSPKLLSNLGDNIPKDINMAKYTGVCEVTAKVWETIGGKRVYPDVTVNQSIEADWKQTVAGVAYLHLTSPIIGWSKAEWFTYTEETTPPPVEPPPTPTTKKVVKSTLYFDDNTTEDLYPV